MGRGRAGLTPAIRAELANLPFGSPPDRKLLLAELSGMLRAGGMLHRAGGGPLDLGLTTSDPAVARRAFRLAKQLTRRAPEVATRAGGPRGPQFRVLVAGADDLASDDELWATPRWVRGSRRELSAFLRGALLVRGSVNHPRAAIHAELSFSRGPLVADVAAAIRRAWGVHVHADEDRARVVLSSAEAVGALLVEVGATQAFLVFDSERLARDLRRQASRLANADAANVARATGAARRQVAAIRAVLGTERWDTLDEDHHETALARLANPDLSLAEVGKLLDPPVAKATVHRRLARVEALAGERAATPPS